MLAMGTGILGALVAALLSSCLIDDSERCGPNQVYDSHMGCACEAGSVKTDTGCIKCGANEVAKSTACECAEGFARNPATKLCEAGSPCGTACDAAKPRCVAAKGGAYCAAAGCTKEAGCATGETCAVWDANPYCMRAPTGVGKTCAAAADCAGQDADFCEATQSKMCLPSGCTPSKNDCATGNSCCDLSAFGLTTLCVPTGSCPI